MTRSVPTLPPVRADVAYVETLTDEELAVLDDPGLDDTGLDDPGPIAVRPRFDELTAVQQDVARQVAFRGLLARGIVDPPSAEAVADASARGGHPDIRIDVLVRHDVQSLVTLRRGAAVMVAIARTTSAGQDYWYAYVIDDMALIEEVTESGLHRFGLVRDDQLLDLVVASAVHPDTADATGPPVAVPDHPGPDHPGPDHPGPDHPGPDHPGPDHPGPDHPGPDHPGPDHPGPDHPGPDGPPPRSPLPDPPPILQTLGRALLRADFVVRYNGEVAPQTTSLFTGPAGSWLVAHRDDEPSVAFPMRSHELREHVRATVREARAGARHG